MTRRKPGLGFWAPAADTGPTGPWGLDFDGTTATYVNLHSDLSRLHVNQDNWSFWIRTYPRATNDKICEFMFDGNNYWNLASGSTYQGFRRGVSGNNVARSGTPTILNDEIALLVRYTNSSTYNVWRDNVELSSGIHPVTSLTGGTRLQLGLNVSHGLDGIIDEVAAWDRVLTDQEKDDLYTDGPGAVSNPFVWHDFSDGQGSQLSDVSGNSRHGTIVGAEWVLWPNYLVTLDGSGYIDLPLAVSDLFLDDTDFSVAIECKWTTTEVGMSECGNFRNSAGNWVETYLHAVTATTSRRAFNRSSFDTGQNRGNDYSPVGGAATLHSVIFYGPEATMNRVISTGQGNNLNQTGRGNDPQSPIARIGMRHDGTNGFVGQIARFAVFDGSLGTADRDLWISGETDPSAYTIPPVGYWNLQSPEPGGTIAVDISGNGNDGTIVNGTWELARAPTEPEDSIEPDPDQ